jgi:hypothetical protein
MEARRFGVQLEIYGLGRLYSYHQFVPGDVVENALRKGSENKQIKKIKTQTLGNILELYTDFDLGFVQG